MDTNEVDGNDSLREQLMAVRDQINTSSVENDDVKEEKPDTEPKPDVVSEVEPEAEPETSVVTEREPTTESKSVLAPATWSATAKSKWAALPPEIQAEVAKRESDIHREFTRQDGERNFGRTIAKTIEPYTDIIRTAGVDPSTAIASLFNTAKIFQTGTPEIKLQALRNIAQEYNIPLDDLNNETYVDPAVAELHQRINRMEFERQQQSRMSSQSSLINEINAFAAEPGHEHFEELRPMIGAMLQSGQAQTLQEAYEAAKWARPDLRSNLLAASQREAEEKRLAQVKAKAESARKAGSSVSGSQVGSVGTDNSAMSLRDELKSHFKSGRI